MYKIKIGGAVLNLSMLLTSINAAYSDIYVGVNVGYANNGIKPKWEDGVQTNLLKKVNKFDGVPGGVHFGWERSNPSKLFTAVEIGIDLLPQSKKGTISGIDSSATYKVEKGFSTGFALKGGYSFDKFTPYVGVGVIGTSWKQKYQVIDDGATVLNSKKSSFQLGGAPIGGIQVKFGHWITGIEYKYVMYRKQGLNVVNDDIDFDNLIIIKPRSHDVRARLSYAF